VGINDGTPGLANTAGYGKVAWCKTVDDVGEYIFR